MKKFIKKHWLLVISVLYLIWPLDFIADIFGPFGLLDDASLLIAAIGKELYTLYKNRSLKDTQTEL